MLLRGVTELPRSLSRQTWGSGEEEDLQEAVKKRLKSDPESDLLYPACLVHKWANESELSENKAGRDFRRSSAICLPRRGEGRKLSVPEPLLAGGEPCHRAGYDRLERTFLPR